MNFSTRRGNMSILNFTKRNTKKYIDSKFSTYQSFNMQNHLKKFAEEVKMNATCDPELNPVYKLFKEQMNQCKKR
jgi:hypothetical protein